MTLLARVVLCVALLWQAVVVAPEAEAQARRPLLVEGTTTLYQRVITRPGATLAPRDRKSVV